MLDVYIYNRLRKSHKHRKLKVWSHIAFCFLQYALIIWVIFTPKDTVSDAGLNALMWGLYLFFMVLVPKFIYVLFDKLSRWRRFSSRGGKVVRGCGTILSLAAIGVMAWGVFVTPYTYEVKEVTLEYPDLPAEFDGYRIVQFSDTHLGFYGDDTTFIAKCVDAMNALNPDMICFTGDLVSRHMREARPFKSVFSRLKARDGIYSIPGNHENTKYWRWEPGEKVRDSLELISFHEEIGWKFLKNKADTLRRGDSEIVMIGTDSYYSRYTHDFPRLEMTYPDRRDDKFKIYLQHNPLMWRELIVDTTTIQLTLAGHTHAMQMELDLFGLRLSPAVIRVKEWGGLYEDRNQKMYVNIGLGEVGVPMRIGATPEITLITLKRKK